MDLVGKYKIHSMAKAPFDIETYLEKLGAGFVLKQVMLKSRPTLEVIYHDDTGHWSVTTSSIFFTHGKKFHDGIAFQDRTYDSRICQSIALIETDSRIVISQVCEELEGPPVTITLEKIDHETLNVTFVARLGVEKGDAMMLHSFKKVAPEEAEVETPEDEDVEMNNDMDELE